MGLRIPSLFLGVVDKWLGATGGAIGALVTTPMDVITIRIITQREAEADECVLAEEDAADVACAAPLGFVDMAQQVWAEGGLAALFSRA